MIKCPSCSHENVDGTTFCEMCGEDLQSAGSAAAPVAAGSTPAASGGDIQCPACENMNPPENVVCEVCGTPLRDGDDDSAVADTVMGTAVADADAAAAPPVSTPPPGGVITDADAAQTASTPATSSLSAPDVTVPDASAPDVAPTTPAPGGAVAVSTPAALDADSAASAATLTGTLKPGSVKLVVEQGMTVGKQFVLGDTEVQVGREDEDEGIYPDIDLADQDEGYVHREHATLKFENDQLFVTHLGGANKSRLNNKPIPDNEPQAVSIGDKLAFGKVVLRVLSV